MGVPLVTGRPNGIQETAMKKIKVLIVDDSAVVRQTLQEILSSDPQIEVIATAGDPFIAADKIREHVPDVITLDVEMPRMDGITFLQKIMSQHPIPVVICSSLTGDGAETTFKALEYGAVEIITKAPNGDQTVSGRIQSKDMRCGKGRGISDNVKHIILKPAVR